MENNVQMLISNVQLLLLLSDSDADLETSACQALP
jgi:hypothetical protein